MTGFFKKDKKEQQQTSTSNPWAPTMPALNDLLGKIQTAGSGLGTLNPTQVAAFGQAKANAAAGNPWMTDIAGLTDDLFATQSQSGTVTDAYADLTRRLSPYADGKNLDLEENPYIERMLQSTADAATNKVNSLWAGAGRDFSAGHGGAVAKTISDARLPTLANLYESEVGRTLDASKTLYGAGAETGKTVQALDKDALNTNAMGAESAQLYQQLRDAGPQAILALENMMKTLPAEELKQIAAVLYPAAGLGGTTTGTAKTTGTAWGGQMDIGKLLAGLVPA